MSKSQQPEQRAGNSPRSSMNLQQKILCKKIKMRWKRRKYLRDNNPNKADFEKENLMGETKLITIIDDRKISRQSTFVCFIDMQSAFHSLLNVRC